MHLFNLSTFHVVIVYEKKTELRNIKRKYKMRDCQHTLFSSSTEALSLTLPNIILQKDLI